MSGISRSKPHGEHSILRKLATTILVALLAATASTGCGTFASVKYFGNPANPFPNVRTIAVAPFVNLSAEPSLDFIEVADIFAGELAQFPGFQVRRPAVLIADARQHGVPLPFPDVSAAVKLAQAVGADAIVIGAITEYDPYYPPRVSVALQLVYAGEKIDPVMDISLWVESGRPLAIRREDAPRLLAMFEETFDSSKRFVRMEIQGYAKTHVSDDRVFEEEETFLRIMNKYMQFVSNRLIRKVIDIEETRQKKAKSEKCGLRGTFGGATQL